MSNNLIDASYLIVDWGTTNFRAFAMSQDHELIETKELAMGLLQVKDRDFSGSLESVLKEWIEHYRVLPIYMAGMVGSMKGWVNVDYAQAPTSPNDLIQKSHRFTLPWGPQATIIPGVCYNYDNDKFDVMRGEEVQVFGLSAMIDSTDFCTVLPGTHSKHINIVNGQISSFSSHLTGEMYDVLSKHSLLGKDLPKSCNDEAAFLKGVADGQDGEFTNRIFLAWTNRLFGKLQTEQIPDYLSGLLIGFELRRLSSKHIYIVGGSSLSKRYQTAAKALQVDSTICSGNECFLSGMKLLIKELS
jgi:2-dehydro-3-deoxygalactonokinase